MDIPFSSEFFLTQVGFLRCGGVRRMPYDTLSKDDLRDVYDGRLESEVASSNDGRLYGQWAKLRLPIPEKAKARGRGHPWRSQYGLALSALAFELFVLCDCI